MKVETYEVVSEVGVDGKIENIEETKQLIEKLGLDGQSKFIAEGRKELSPYRKMTAQESLVYSTILSKKTDLKEYDDEVVPLRCLQIASHALELGICEMIEVWHKPNADIKDPLLVGRKGSEWSGERFILARWGEELLPFSELCTIAKTLLKHEIIHKLEEGKNTFEVALKSVDSLVEKSFNKGSEVSISANIY